MVKKCSNSNYRYRQYQNFVFINFSSSSRDNLPSIKAYQTQAYNPNGSSSASRRDILYDGGYRNPRTPGICPCISPH